MNLPVVVGRAAQQEFDAAVAWYEAQRSGLGRVFAVQVRGTFDRIAAVPLVHQRIHKDVRRAPVRQFPYSVYYRVEEARITVISVFHSKRDPAVWQRRV